MQQDDVRRATQSLLEKVKGDTSLQKKLKAAADANAVSAIAKEEGFSISAADLTQAQSELSEEELEGVAGGGLKLKTSFRDQCDWWRLGCDNEGCW